MPKDWLRPSQPRLRASRSEVLQFLAQNKNLQRTIVRGGRALADSVLYCSELGDAVPPTTLFPPHGGILRTVQHLRQFLFDLGQAVGAHFHRRLVDLTIRALGGRASVGIPQIRYLLTKTGEMFQDIGHVLIIPQYPSLAAQLIAIKAGASEFQCSYPLSPRETLPRNIRYITTK